MLCLQIGLVAETVAEIDHSELAYVAEALQKQATDHFSPHWGVEATVTALDMDVTGPQDVPPPYLPLIIGVNVGEKEAGYHLDEHGRPYAVAEPSAGKPWQVWASHECLEMLADPFGNRFMPGQSLEPSQGLVGYLVEVCDPCRDSTYEMNGVPVSDFCTPDFYNPAAAVSGRYTFRNAIAASLGVMPGGYVRWYEPKEGHLWQAMNPGGDLMLKDLGPAEPWKSPREAPVTAPSQTKALAKAPPSTPRTGRLIPPPEYHHLVYQLATDKAFYERFLTDTRAVYKEYGIDVPQELLPHPVKLPPQQKLQEALRSGDVSLGLAPSGGFGALPMSTCSFVSVP